MCMTVKSLPIVCTGRRPRLYGDSAYRGKKQRERLEEIAPRAKDFTNKWAHRNPPLSDADRETNRGKSSASVRAKVEHPFQMLKPEKNKF